jgi:hypothetical protein
MQRCSSAGSAQVKRAIGLLVHVFFLLGAGAAHAQHVTIAWDRVSDPAVVGYTVHVGIRTGE